jgi:hypothetical protein
MDPINMMNARCYGLYGRTLLILLIFQVPP